MARVLDVSTWLKLAVIPLAGLMAACNSSSDNTGVGSSTTAISGSVVAAPVSTASVVARDSGGNVVAGPVTTNADGTFTLRIPYASLASTLVLESSGGSFSDEATGLVSNAGILAAYLAGGSLSAGAQVHMTPASTIIRDLVTTHGMTPTAAQAAFSAAFGFAPDTSIAPVDATDPATGASTAQLLAGLRAAAFSQMTMDLGLTASEQFDLLTALAADLADGSLDGVGSSGAISVAGITLPADVQNRFGQAMLNFHTGAHDATGLGNDMIGTLPFAKIAQSNSYHVEYVADPMMGAMEGKTTFKLRIADSSGNPVSDAVSLMPMMYMASGMMHSSPTSGCTESATAGEYDCTVYYLMPSAMSNGMAMGYWQLKVMIGGMMGESVSFSPSVMMAMGDTVKAVLKGQSGDQIMGMLMPESRSYYLFRDGLTGATGNHTLNLFIAARESMMSFPAVSLNTVLNASDANYELTVASMSVDVSTDGGTSWVSASDNGGGHWSAAGISGLTDGSAGTVSVRLTINGEQKTTNGLAADGSNDYASFTVTP